MMSLLACQRVSPSGSGTRGGQRSIALRFIAMSISMYSLVVVILTCPSQDLITLSSAPDWSRCRAVVCLLPTLAVFDRFVSRFGRADRGDGFAIGMVGPCRVSGAAS